MSTGRPVAAGLGGLGPGAGRGQGADEFGEHVGRDAVVVVEDDDVLDHVAQLPDVPGQS
jgi:NAD(P)H-hydrate repair Nnr-like enzyme with NAD(P)H-hydrate dehydratase domain